MKMTGKMRNRVQIWKRPPSIEKVIKNAALVLSLVEWTEFYREKWGRDLPSGRSA